jgi:hypothetical protein
MSSQFHNPTFIRHAHRRAVLQFLQRMLKENHLQIDSAPREAIICEDVLYADRIVSQDALIEVLDGLEQLENMETLGMNEFELKRRGTASLRLPPPPKENASDVIDEQPKEQTGTGQGPQQAGGPEDRQGGTPATPGKPGDQGGSPGTPPSRAG